MRTKCLLALVVPLYDRRVSNPSLSLGDFHAWADDQKVERRCEVRDEPLAGGGRGLVALERLESGDVAVCVPLSATLRVETCAHYDTDDKWAGALASKLCAEAAQGSSSSMAPYIQVGLPKEAPRTICRWSSSERLALQNPNLVDLSFENAAWRHRQFQTSRDEIDASFTSKSKFMQMLDLVCSRTLKGKDGSRMLVPFIDNANHAPREAGGGFFRLNVNNNNKEPDTVSLVVGERGVNAGEAVTLDYGGRTVEDYLLHYGFVPHRCPSDSIEVPIFGDGLQVVSWEDCGTYSGHVDANVRLACSNLLASFPTTLEEDVALMRETSYSEAGGGEALMTALEYRFAKKSLLAQASGIQSSNFAFAMR